MTTIELITALRKLNITPVTDGFNVKLIGDTKMLPKELFSEIKENKEEFIKFLLEIKTNAVLEPIPVISKQEYYPLSNSQMRLWILSQFEGGSRAYNITSALYLKGVLNIEVLNEAFRICISRHESLRTTFHEYDNNPVQKIAGDMEFSIKIQDISNKNDKHQKLEEEINKVYAWDFDLTKGPLIHIKLLILSEDEFALAFAMHHIISDGWSIGVLIQEVMSLYKKLCTGGDYSFDNTQINYKDYTVWLNTRLHGDKGTNSRGFWSKQNLGDVPPINLPYDFSRPDINDFEGAIEKFYFDEAFYPLIELLASRNKTTVFNVYRSVLSICLHKISRQDTLIIGTPVAGRIHPDLNNQIGVYVNTLPLKSFYDGSVSFTDYLSLISSDSIQSFEHQEYPLDQIIQDSISIRDKTRNPLFDVLMVVQNTSIGDGTIDFENQYGFKMHLIDNYLGPDFYNRQRSSASKVDLTFNFSVAPGGKYYTEIEYRTSLFGHKTINTLYNSFNFILKQVIKTENILLSEIQLLNEEARNQILLQFNQPVNVLKEAHVLGLMHDSFRLNSEKIALLSGNESFNYRDVEDRANKIAGAIIRLTGPDQKIRAGLFLKRSEHVIFSVLGILKTNNVYVPIDILYPENRIEYIIEDAEIAILIVDNISKEKIPASFNGLIINAENLDEVETVISLTDFNKENTAYIIYTSGSSGIPKGVEISHKNVIAFLKWADKEFEDTPYEICYASTSYCFDLSIFEMFLPLIQGKKIRLLNSGLDIQEALITDTDVLINTVPSIVRILIDQHIDWNRVTALNMAGESVPKIFKKQLDYHATEVRNLYGPSEDTTYSTVYRFKDEVYDKIPIGHPITNTHLYILDNELNLLPIGVEGQICLAGESVAKGYLNRDELTSSKFIPDPFLENSSMYLTGDIGKWLPDGNVEFIGRADNQVKIRGYRIELDEIQYHLETMPEIREAVVICKLLNNENTIITYWTGDVSIDKIKIEDHLRSHIPGYMLPSYIVHTDAIPVNSNGKVDLQKLQNPTIVSSGEKILPETDLQKLIFSIWCNVLGHSDFGITDNFFGLGGHSLKATRLKSIIAGDLLREISLNEIFMYPTIEGQAAFLEKKDEFVIPVIGKSDQNLTIYPLSFAQEGLWNLNKFMEASKAYHMPAAFEVNGSIDLILFEQALKLIVSKHESLRTVFKETNGIPSQVIREIDEKTIFIEKIDRIIPHPILDTFLKENWEKPFDLENGPLFRCCIFNTSKVRVLSFNMHHIISDGWSIGILIKDLFTAYYSLLKNEETHLDPLEIQYRDFAAWQRLQLTEDKLKHQLSHWKDHVFSSGIPILNLPLDYNRPALKTYSGDSFNYVFSKDIYASIKQSSNNHGVSVFISVLTAVNILLKKISNQNEIVIGVPTAGRDHMQLHDIIGFFVNTLPVLSHVTGEKSYAGLLSEQKNSLLTALEYQNFPFELLVDALQPNRDISRSPLFDVMVVMQESDVLDEILYGKDASTDLHLKRISLNAVVTKYDLTFSFVEKDDELHLELEYNRDLFTSSTISRIVKCLEMIYSAISLDPNVRIKDISVLSEADRSVIFNKADQTWVGYKKSDTIVSVFAKTVLEYPDRIALRIDGTDMTYAELDKKSGQLAYILKSEFNVKHEDPVILFTERSEWMIVSILAVLKTGATYVPIDTDYPETRINYIIDDCGGKLILCDNRMLTESTKEKIEVLDVKSHQYGRETFSTTVSPDYTAYIIYTSGTTGNPKGVLVTHKNVNRLLFNENNHFDFNQHDIWSLFHSYSFDFSVWEIFGCILNGGCLIIVPKDIAQDSLAFYSLIKKEKITVLNQTPTAFRSLTTLNMSQFNQDKLNVRYVIFGGELLMPSILETWHKSFPKCRLINMYGITETTVHVTYKEILWEEIKANKSNIGIPIPTTSCFVLDMDMRPVTFGVTGELCVGGSGVTKGYHNRADLTDEKFIPNPFNPSEKLYRSGDYARILTTGDIEYLGRKDDQIKIRGHRIETGEIETAILENENISAAIVLPYNDKSEDCELWAYVIAADTYDVNELKYQLADRLPSYMIPSYIISIDEIPLTINGKLDKKALFEFNGLQNNIKEYLPPRNPIDEAILAIWMEVLNREKIGINDNFFDLGGHSLKATKVLSKIQQTFKIKIDLKNLFINPTIEHLSNYIETLTWMEKQSLNMESEQDELIL